MFPYYFYAGAKCRAVIEERVSKDTYIVRMLSGINEVRNVSIFLGLIVMIID